MGKRRTKVQGKVSPTAEQRPARVADQKKDPNGRRDWTARRVALVSAFVTITATLITAGTTFTVNALKDPSTYAAPTQGVSPSAAPVAPDRTIPQTASLPFSASVGVANVTAGDTKYSPTVVGDNGDLLKFQIVVQNRSTVQAMSGLHVDLRIAKVDNGAASVSAKFSGPIEPFERSASVQAKFGRLDSVDFDPSRPTVMRAPDSSGTYQELVLSSGVPNQPLKFDFPVIAVPVGQDAISLTVFAVVHAPTAG